MFSLGGKLALITGSSAGIGYALAEALAGGGAEIVLNGRDASRLGMQYRSPLEDMPDEKGHAIMRLNLDSGSTSARPSCAE